MHLVKHKKKHKHTHTQTHRHTHIITRGSYNNHPIKRKNKKYSHTWRHNTWITFYFYNLYTKYFYFVLVTQTLRYFYRWDYGRRSWIRGKNTLFSEEKHSIPHQKTNKTNKQAINYRDYFKRIFSMAFSKAKQKPRKHSIQ